MCGVQCDSWPSTSSSIWHTRWIHKKHLRPYIYYNICYYLLYMTNARSKRTQYVIIYSRDYYKMYILKVAIQLFIGWSFRFNWNCWGYCRRKVDHHRLYLNTRIRIVYTALGNGKLWWGRSRFKIDFIAFDFFMRGEVQYFDVWTKWNKATVCPWSRLVYGYIFVILFS